MLLVLAGDQRGTSVLAQERTVVDRAVADLFDVLGPADEQELAQPLVSALQAYRRAADGVTSVALGTGSARPVSPASESSAAARRRADDGDS